MRARHARCKAARTRQKLLPIALYLGLLSTACGGSDESSGNSATTDLRVTIGGSEAAFPHADGHSGQTAKNVTAGVRSLTLLDDAGGQWVLFDAKPANAAVSYADGAKSELAVVAPAAVRAGHYTKARLVQDWSRFDIAATLHEGGSATAGTLHGLTVTSDGALVDGKELPSGHYAQTFTAGGLSHDYTGTTPIPEHSTTAGAEAVVEDGEWAVYFPVDLSVAAGQTGTLAIRVNLDHAFRWSDLPGAGYAEGTYDIAPPLYEPVEQFGGNRFDVTLD